ncbi:MAG: hypothetical protein JSV30_01030 [Candidatus Omnitrophota bacterium]|nr:MAG: hypothetical protein JSV30_01030 [Candidatus Omnitrophota bacterium]
MEEKKIGVVTHYFGHIGVGIIKLEKEGLKLGDTLHFKGHTSDFQQTVDSMQIEHKDVQEAKVGDSVGVKLNEHVREHDEVFKVVA